MYLSHCFKPLLTRRIPLRIYSISSALCNIDYVNRSSPTYNTNVTLSRQFSVQSAIESVVKTQTGIIQSISESTAVSYVQDFILNIHSHTGLPWWASIVLTTVLLRTCITFPFAIHQNYIMAKIENLKVEFVDLVKELQKETAIAARQFNWDEKQAKAAYFRSLKNQWNKLIVRDNCHPFKASFLLWIQLPMWVMFSISLRNLTYMLPKGDSDAVLTFLEFTVGGIAWIPNLTVPDTSLILPAALGLINLAIIEIQTMTKVHTPTKLQRYATNIFRGISVVMIPIAASVPSCLCVYWVTSSTCGLAHNLILLSPKFKRLTRIPKTSVELEHPYSLVASKFKHKFSFKKQESAV